MNYQNTTQVPNSLFDEYIPQLKPSEIIILLIIIRQTIGWYNPKTKKRKVRDWISYAQFKKKSNLSKKTISNAINTLIMLNIISANDRNGRILSNTNERKGKLCIYYTCLLVDREKSNMSNVKKGTKPRENLHITKLTSTKLIQQKVNQKTIKRISDAVRISEILKKQ